MDPREIRVESPLTRMLFDKASKAKIPLSGTFELSPVCNFSCRMCYVRKTQAEVIANPRQIMTLEEWKKLAEEMKQQGMLYLLLTGGEPFLWPNFWELYDYLYKMGFMISINSNGSLIDDTVIQRLQKKPPGRINITLYGTSNDTYYELCGVHNVFDRVTHAILGLKKAGIQVKLNCSLTPQNAADLASFDAFAKEHDLILTVATYMYPPIRRDSSMVGQNERFTPKEMAYYHLLRYRLQYGEELYQQYLVKVIDGIAVPLGLDSECMDPADGKIRCRAGNASFWVTWEGYMTPCGMMPEPKIDLRAAPFEEAWKQLVDISENVRISGVCGSCENQNVCHACAAMALAETGTTAGVPTYLCQMTQELKLLAQKELRNQH